MHFTDPDHFRRFFARLDRLRATVDALSGPNGGIYSQAFRILGISKDYRYSDSLPANGIDTLASVVPQFLERRRIQIHQSKNTVTGLLRAARGLPIRSFSLHDAFLENLTNSATLLLPSPALHNFQ